MEGTVRSRKPAAWMSEMAGRMDGVGGFKVFILGISDRTFD